MRVVEKLIYKSIEYKKRNRLRLSELITYIIRIVFSCDIRPETEIGCHVEFVHNGLGVVIHPETKIGDNCMIYQNVTLGGNTKIDHGEIINKGAPIIQNDVKIYAGAVILGPVTIGHHSVIGANSVITKDIPPYSVAYSKSQLEIKEIR